MQITGIHHITALSSDAQKTYDFYTHVLGLRLVKKTVNFDAPTVYHLYFGDYYGAPGTILTFFPFPDAGTGMRGRGQVTKIYLAIPQDSFGFWIQRFVEMNVRHSPISSRFNEKFITFYDPDGLQLELVSTNLAPKSEQLHPDIPLADQIAGIKGAELSVDSQDSIHDLLTDILDYKQTDQSEMLIRYTNKHASDNSGEQIIDILVMKDWPEGVVSAGTNHHIAFRVKDKAEQLQVRERIIDMGFMPTPVVDRQYFTSVYFRERNNILFEIATDEPGFDVDEDVSKLGTALKLPPQYEPSREFITSKLPELHTGERFAHYKQSTNSDLELFKYKFIDNHHPETIILLHGTGGNEMQMLEFARDLGIKQNILSIRGNVVQAGANRYFLKQADTDGADTRFDMESIQTEILKFANFLTAAQSELGIVEQPISILGYSNGANFGLGFALTQPFKFEHIWALHPMDTQLNSQFASTNSLHGTKVTITYGESDEYSTPDQISGLNQTLQAGNATIELQQFPGGHGISDAEIAYLRTALY